MVIIYIVVTAPKAMACIVPACIVPPALNHEPPTAETVDKTIPTTYHSSCCIYQPSDDTS